MRWQDQVKSSSVSGHQVGQEIVLGPNAADYRLAHQRTNVGLGRRQYTASRDLWHLQNGRNGAIRGPIHGRSLRVEQRRKRIADIVFAQCIEHRLEVAPRRIRIESRIDDEAAKRAVPC